MNLINTVIFLSVTVVFKVLGVQVCGKALADMLDLVCDGRGFHWINPDALPTISKRSAVQYLASSDPFQRRGVVSECCRNSCSLAHMESYCAAPSGVHYPNPTSGPITEDVANDIIESASLNNYPDSLTTAPPPTTTRPPSQNRFPNLQQLFSGNSNANFGLPRGQGRYAGLGKTPFFFVRPVGPMPTRTPVVA